MQPSGTAFVFEDPNDVVDTWYKIFNGIIDEHLPLKQKRVRRKFQPKWFNAKILKGIKARDKLLKKARKTKQRATGIFERVKNSVTKTYQEY